MRRLALMFLAGAAVLGAQHFHTAVGVTGQGSPIRAAAAWEALRFESSKPAVLLVGGLDGSPQSTNVVLALLHSGLAGGDFAVSAVANAAPDGPFPPAGAAAAVFPPEGAAYGGANAPAHYLWRFIGMHAPDLVVEVRAEAGAAGGLTQALAAGAAPAGVGGVAAREFLLAGAGEPEAAARRLLGEIRAALGELSARRRPQAAREEMRRRLRRGPVEIAEQLEAAYGRRLDQVAYIPALALAGRLRLDDLVGSSSRLADAERIVSPYLAGKPTPAGRVSGSILSGHLLFGDLYERTGKPAYLDLLRKAADFGFNPDGSLKRSMPFHNEMSDSVFMGCAVLARAGRLTGEARYFQMALRHLRFMQRLDLREDGLYRHSPLDEAAWGRGNGFPALGLALALSDWPPGRPGYKEALAAFQRHMAALVRRQDETGAWHQVIDRPESYREFTATAMIGFALTRGLRRGRLDRREFESAADRAWYALKTRIAADASLVDVCRSTGRQASLRAYFDREAILGRDDRGGAMALLAATERAWWQRER